MKVHRGTAYLFLLKVYSWDVLEALNKQVLHVPHIKVMNNFQNFIARVVLRIGGILLIKRNKTRILYQSQK